MSLVRVLAALTLAAAVTACLQVDHFTGEPTGYDNLYFAPRDSAPLRPEISEDKWRLYALLGLVDWKEEQLVFAGDRFARVHSDDRPLQIRVVTEATILNSLANIGAGIIPFGALLFTSRSTQVVGWQAESAEASPDSEQAPDS